MGIINRIFLKNWQITYHKYLPGVYLPPLWEVVHLRPLSVRPMAALLFQIFTCVGVFSTTNPQLLHLSSKAIDYPIAHVMGPSILFSGREDRLVNGSLINGILTYCGFYTTLGLNS